MGKYPFCNFDTKIRLFLSLFENHPCLHFSILAWMRQLKLTTLVTTRLVTIQACKLFIGLWLATKEAIFNVVNL